MTVVSAFGGIDEIKPSDALEFADRQTENGYQYVDESGNTRVVEIFLANGTWSIPDGVNSFDYFVVGGGGSGASRYAGGGGAGGVITGVVSSVSGLDSRELSIVVGAGGAAVSGRAIGKKGSPSSIVATIGSATVKLVEALGGGAGRNSNNGSATDVNGGSGGGGAYGGVSGGTANAGSVYSADWIVGEKFANIGGNGSNNSGDWKGGGGGGAGKAGASYTDGSKGGDGIETFITGISAWFAGGGGGANGNGSSDTAPGGKGGGGASAGNVTATSGVANTGSGGGGLAYEGSSRYSGAGGSGIVIISYLFEADQSKPEVQYVLTPDSSGTSAKLVVTVAAMGEGATKCDLFLAYGASAGALGEEIALGSVMADGAVITKTIDGLLDNTAYHCVIRVVNDVADAKASVVSVDFTTPENFHTTYARGFAMRDDFTFALPFTVSGLADGVSLANFPLLVRLSENSPAGFSYADLQRADKRDLVFIDAEGKTLPFEIDTWNPSGETLIWVTIPEFENGTTFALCYGSEKDGVGLVRTSPWADYTGVWHLGEDGGANTVVNDSTANLITGEAWGTGTCRVDGPIGYGRKNSTNDAQNKEIRMDLTSSGREAQLAAVQALGSTFSVSFWMKLNGSCNYCCYVGRKSTHDKDATWGLVSNDGSTQSALLIYSGTTGSGNAGASVSGFSGFNGTWRKVDLIYTDTTCSIYCDGAVVWNNQTLKGGAAKQLENTNLSLGGWTEHGWGSVKGDFDEFRLRAGALSADWVATEYANENGTSFVTAGEVAVLSDEPALKTTVTEVGGNYFKVKVTVANAGLDPASVVTVFGGCAVSGSEVVLNKTFGAGLKTGESVTAVFAGLPLAGAIDYGFKAVNENATESEIVTDSVTLDASGLGGADEPIGTGGDEVKVLNGDEIHIFRTVGSGMLTLPERVTDARILVVGGGGSGGGDCGGGGGAGGYVALSGLTITLGEHAVTVGAGGAKSGQKGMGVNGEDSSFFGYTAVGGGGGAAWSGGKVVGKEGGSGGGSLNSSTGGASVQAAQGYGLGNVGGASAKDNVGGGGGGAGSAGSPNSGDVGGAGGLGVVNDITGEDVVYAAGGGGGDCATGRGGAGGSGNVGGHGGSLNLTVIDGVTVSSGCGFPGRDGTGSGGGGSAGSGQGGYGGAGGSGIVVVRFPLPGSIANVTAPVVRFGERVIADGDATIPYAVLWPGKGKATCSVILAYGFSADRLDFTADLGVGLIGDGVAMIENLIPNRTYYYRLTVSNGDETTVTELQSFTVSDEAAWPTAFADGLPVIASATLGTLTEDEAPISGTFANFVAGAVVTIHYSVNGVDWSESVCEATADGFAGAIRNLSGKTLYTYYLTAEANGLQDRLPAATFTSLANSGAEIASALTVSATARTVTVGGEVYDVGAAGTATVKLMIRLDGANWTQVGAKEVTSAGVFSFEYAGAGTLSFGTDYAVKVVIENTVGAKTYTSETELGSFSAIDGTVYTWKGGTGDWNDAANWTASGEGDNAGYPVAGSTAEFADGAVATVRVTRAECAATLCAAGAASVRLIGVGDASALALDEMTGLANAFAIDDLPVTCEGFVELGGASGDPTTLTFAGDRTVLNCLDGVGFATAGKGDCMLAFEVPDGGYSAIPLQVGGTGTFPRSGDAGIRVTVDGDSAFLRHFTKNQQVLVQCRGVTIDSGRLALVDPAGEGIAALEKASAMIWVNAYIAEYKGVKYDSIEAAVAAAAADSEPGAIRIFADADEENTGISSEVDPSKEIVIDKTGDTPVPVVQTATAIMQGVTAGGKALTANTAKLRAFLTANGIAAYTAPHTSSEAIGAALTAVPTGDGVNGLSLWKDYALGITPTDSVKAVADAAKDTDPNAITLAIPTIDPAKASGDFTIEYQVVDRAGKQETTTATDPRAIKIPLATGIYDVKIVFESK